MSPFDWIALVILLWAGYRGMQRGFLGAALNLAAWAGAIFLAFAFGDLLLAIAFPGLPGKIEGWLSSNPLASAIFRGPEVASSIALWSARLGLLIAVLLAGTTLSGLLSRAVEGSVLASANRALGILLGAAKGWLMAGGLLLLCIHVGPDSWISNSLSRRFLEPVSDALDLLLRALGGQ